jgi:hypothetical protein
MDGKVVVVTRRTRVYLDREAWEQVPPDGLYVQWVVPTDGEPAWVWAMTRAELEDIFGEVTESRSWEQYRCWHFPTPPEAIEAFKVLSHGAAQSTSSSGVLGGAAIPKHVAATRHTATPPPSSHATPPSAKAPRPNLLVPKWAAQVEDADQRHLFAVLDRNGMVEETEAIRILGTARGWRKFLLALDDLRARLPYEVEMVPTPTGSALRRVGSA